MDINTLAIPLGLLTLGVLICKAAREFVLAMRTANAAMNKWPWYWPQKYRNDD
jgi:hypothetical protein